MSDFWKPTVIVIAMMIMFGAVYLRHFTPSNAADNANAAVVSPEEITRAAGPLPSTVIEDYQ
jgi:hypothetical protein